MSHNPKLAKLQKNISLNELKNSNLEFIEKFISDDNLTELNNNLCLYHRQLAKMALVKM